MDWHQIELSQRYCQTILEGYECDHSRFHEVPMMDFLTVFCASLLWMVYLKRSDSEKYYSAQDKQNGISRHHQRSSVAENSVSISQEPDNIQKSASYDDNYARKFSASAYDDAPVGGNFQDNNDLEPEIEISRHESSFHHQSLGTAYD